MRNFCKGYTWGWVGYKGEYKTKEAEYSMKRLRATGTDYLCLAFGITQEKFCSTKIAPTFGRTVTDLEVIHAINMAHELGMKVCLKPVVNCEDGTWRAWINFPPTNNYWETWFKSYTAFMCHYAEIAQETGCEMFCTGCEMVSMDRHEELCRKMVAEVRKIYKGPIMHNVNHGSEFNAKWLDAVDIIGVSGYYPTSDGKEKSRETMMKAWAEVKELMTKVHETYKKPVLFAEIGVRSESGCTQYPWDCSIRPVGVDEEEQANFYDTAMETFWDIPWFEGFFWWDWPAILYPLDKAHEDQNFCIYGKKAEEVMTDWYTNK